MTAILRRTRPLILAALALASGGCALLNTPPPPKLYQVTPATGFPPLPHTAAQLTIDMPVAAAGLDTPRIALSRSPVSLDYFAEAAWSDRAAAMVRLALVESFENSGAIAAVGSGAFNLRSDFELKSELRDFTALYDSPVAAGAAAPTVRVTLSLKLVKTPERTVVAETVVSERERAAANEIPQIVEAFNTALGRALKRTVVWTLTNPALSQPRRSLSSTGSGGMVRQGAL